MEKKLRFLSGKETEDLLKKKELEGIVDLWENTKELMQKKRHEEYEKKMEYCRVRREKAKEEHKEWCKKNGKVKADKFFKFRESRIASKERFIKKRYKELEEEVIAKQTERLLEFEQKKKNALIWLKSQNYTESFIRQGVLWVEKKLNYHILAKRYWHVVNNEHFSIHDYKLLMPIIDLLTFKTKAEKELFCKVEWVGMQYEIVNQLPFSSVKKDRNNFHFIDGELKFKLPKKQNDDDDDWETLKSNEIWFW